jgi:hypothetical protein
MIKNLILSLWYRYKEWQYERKCIKHLGIKPTKIYLNKEDFDFLQKKLQEPPDPKTVERLKELMSKKSPWDT